MRRTVVIAIILAAAFAVAAPNMLSAQQGRQGKGMGPGMGMMSSSPCPQMMGKGMMSGQGMRGMTPGMGMMPMGHGMMGMGSWAGKLSEADRGELLVLKGQMMRKHAEIMKKQAEAMIAEGQRLQKSGK